MSDTELNEKLSEGYRLLDLYWNNQERRDQILLMIKDLIEFHFKEKEKQTAPDPDLKK